MKKTIVGVFAHPDDEAFGPSGTIAKLAKVNNVHLLCATKGEEGQDAENDHNVKLEQRRVRELRASANVLGVKNVYFLGFKDGTLSNNLYHKIADKIQIKLEELKPEILITFCPNGVSGHLDHIAISYITSFVFERVPFVKELWQHCILDTRSAMMKNYFVYFPQGYRKSEIDKIVDIKTVWDTKIKAMMQHKSQLSDVQRILDSFKNTPKEEYFLVIKK